MDFGSEIIVLPILFLGLPWVILHYVTKWKTAATITSDDEVLLEELYNLAKRLDERMNTVERLVAAEDASFSPSDRSQKDRLAHEQQMAELENIAASKKGTKA